MISLLRTMLDETLAPIYYRHSDKDIIEALDNKDKMSRLLYAVRIPLTLVRRKKQDIKEGKLENLVG